MVRQPPDRRRDGRLRLRDRRENVIAFPSTTKRLVEQDELARDILLGGPRRLLHIKLLTLSIEDIQEVRQATVIAFEGEIDGSPALRERGLKILQVLARSAVMGDGVVHLRNCHHNGFPVVHQKLLRLELLGDDERIQASEIQDRKVSAWPDRPDRTPKRWCARGVVAGATLSAD